MSTPKLTYQQVQEARRLFHKKGLCPKCIRHVLNLSISQAAFSEMLHYGSYRYVPDNWLESKNG